MSSIERLMVRKLCLSKLLMKAVCCLSLMRVFIGSVHHVQQKSNNLPPIILEKDRK